MQKEVETQLCTEAVLPDKGKLHRSYYEGLVHDREQCHQKASK